MLLYNSSLCLLLLFYFSVFLEKFCLIWIKGIIFYTHWNACLFYISGWTLKMCITAFFFFLAVCTWVPDLSVLFFPMLENEFVSNYSCLNGTSAQMNAITVCLQQGQTSDLKFNFENEELTLITSVKSPWIYTREEEIRIRTFMFGLGSIFKFLWMKDTKNVCYYYVILFPYPTSHHRADHIS